MNIYLACTVRGDRGGLAVARALADAIEDMGHIVLTRHLLEDDAEASEAQATERAVFERDMRRLESADVLIAEAWGSTSRTAAIRRGSSRPYRGADDRSDALFRLHPEATHFSPVDAVLPFARVDGVRALGHGVLPFTRVHRGQFTAFPR